MKQEHEPLEQPRQISPKPVQKREDNKRQENDTTICQCFLRFLHVQVSVHFFPLTDILSDVPNIIKRFNPTSAIFLTKQKCGI